MIIKIIGKENVTSMCNVTGQVYKGCIIHFTFSDNKVVGIAVGTKYISSRCFPLEEIHIDEEYYLHESERFGTRLQTLDDYLECISSEGGNDQWQDCE
jgi:hypothetical protein